jgi:hypothetical protein
MFEVAVLSDLMIVALLLAVIINKLNKIIEHNAWLRTTGRM